MSRYTNLMVFNFFDEIESASGSIEKRRIIKEYFDEYEDEFIEFLRDVMSPDIIFSVSKETIENYTKYSIRGLSDKYEELSDIIHNIKNKTSTDYLKEVVCSFISKFNNNKRELDIVKRIFLRNIRVGVDSKSVNKSLGFKAIPTFDVQLCEPYEREFIGENMIIEPKLDGVRVVILVSKENISMFTRNGKEVNGYEEIKREIRLIHEDSGGLEFMLDGEIFDTDFDSTMNSLFRKSTHKTAIYNVFDIMPLSNFLDKKCEMSLSDRKLMLLKFFHLGTLKFFDVKNIATVPFTQVKISPSSESDDRANIMAIYNSYVANGFEGAIIKKADSKYDFKRSFAWQKIKPFSTIDLPIHTIVEGSGKYKDTCGSVVVRLNNVDINIGSGFTDIQRDEIWSDPHKYLGVVIEIQYQEITKDGSLRFPSFKAFRYDL